MSIKEESRQFCFSILYPAYMFFYILLLYSSCLTLVSSASLNFQEEGVPSQFFIDDGYFEAYGGNNKDETDPDISSSAVRGGGVVNDMSS